MKRGTFFAKVRWMLLLGSLLAFALSGVWACQGAQKQNESAQETTGQDSGAGEQSGKLGENAKCQPETDTCAEGLKCYATCCGTPPPDGGTHDPNYQCVKVPQGECQPIP